MRKRRSPAAAAEGLGIKISGMAAANLGRNKRGTFLVLLSMSLSLILFNTIYTFSIGFDMDKYLSNSSIPIT